MGQILWKIQATKNLTHKITGPDSLTGVLYQILMEQIIPNLYKLFQKSKQEAIFSNLFIEVSIILIRKARQKHYKERKLQVNIPTEHTRKGSKKFLINPIQQYIKR